ncbi:MAG TPA: PDZ domain-containing protein [Bryobacteraceae bacterium]|jgi:predicted metalloprotease with PDZ domain|nr:PDZ domain-containing protein [Bryobacteraceae bacterium]
MKKAFFLTFAACITFAQDAIRLNVDASEAPKRIFHVHLTIPAKPGPMTLLYPEWIPGEHGPTGPVVDLVGLRITANGQTVAWRRDSTNMFAFHVTVPAGAGALDVAFDQISPPDTSGFSSGASATTELAVLNWNQFVLYPQGPPAAQLSFQANLKVPESWRYGTALPIARESANQIEFQPAPLNTLIDSPVSTGRHYKTIELGRDGEIAHYLHLAADSDRAIEISPEQIEKYKNLVNEAGALFGSRHYRSYHFLYTLSDHVASFGLEHHESSDDRVRERALLDESAAKATADLLPHEFVHSWNGKFRRPAGLVTPDYSEPMKGDLLWVYEGLTQYLGEVLATRSGLFTPQDFRDELAMVAADLDRKAGRKWRPLADTATAAQLLYSARGDYSDYRRGVDYYDEGTLIWLEADVTIRNLSNGRRSLNDFCRSFHGGPGGKPELKPYTLEDVIAGLNAVQAYDWAGFFRARVTDVAPHAPLGGIENGGWKLVYDSNRSALWRDFEDERRGTNLMYSIGVDVKEDGVIEDVAYGGPAERAGLAPDSKIIAVNNRQFTPAILREAVQRTAKDAQSIDLLIKNGEYYSVHRLEYQGGEKYPHLQRDESKADLLSKIVEPLSRKM